MRRRRFSLKKEKSLPKDSILIPKITKEQVFNYIQQHLGGRNSKIPLKRIEVSLPEAVQFFNHNGYQSGAMKAYSELLRGLISELEKEEKIIITYRSIQEGGRLRRFPLIEPFDPAKVRRRVPRQTIKGRFRGIHLFQSRPLRKYWGLILLFLCIPLLIMVVPLFLPKPVVVENNDLVKIKYSVWVSDKYKNYDKENPYFDGQVWVTVISVVDAFPNGLMLGLYNNLLGKVKGFESELIWLNKCVDENVDGVDDITGEPALTYGKSNDLYFGFYLMIKFKVLDIEKP